MDGATSSTSKVVIISRSSRPDCDFDYRCPAPSAISIYELGEAGSLFLTRPRLADCLSDCATTRGHADEIFDALEDGTLHLGISARYTLGQVEIAHAALEERRRLGKSILLIGLILRRPCPRLPLAHAAIASGLAGL